FPSVIRYQLSGEPLSSPGSLGLTARRLEIARQATCASVAGAKWVIPLLTRGHCQAMLRATYADESSSLVLTVGAAVLHDQASAVTVARDLSRQRSGGHGAIAGTVLLRPLAVPGTPAVGFGMRQRQFSWVVNAGSYLVVATVGFADGRPHVPVGTDSY